MAWSVDRLGRSLQDLIGFLSEIHASGIDLFLNQQGLDTTTPAGKALFPDDGRVRRVRAIDDPGTSARRGFVGPRKKANSFGRGYLPSSKGKSSPL
jgi:hypothetical protein